jgi:hypothetical protein
MQEVRSAAAENWPVGESPVAGPVMVTILYFHNNRRIDVDNVPKPIIDALKGLVFEDDEQVTDLVCRKRSLGSVQVAANQSTLLHESLRKGNEFLYIVVTQVPDQEMIL